jgi:hypothetical protein
LLLVVALYFLAAFARQPLSRMILAMQWRPAGLPSPRSRLAILGAPGRPFSSSNTRFISTASDRFDCSLAEGGLRFQA